MLPGITHEFHRFSYWMQTLPEWQQNTIVGLIIVLLPTAALWAPIAWLFKRAKRWYAARRETAALRILQFENRFPAEPGVVDHGVNFFSSIDDIMALLKGDVFGAVSRIRHLLLSDKRLGRLSSKSAQYVNRKQSVLRAIAESMLDDALLLEASSKRIAADAATFREASPAMVKLPVISFEGVKVLREWKRRYLGSVDSLRGLAGLLRRNAHDFRVFSGNQLDLTRVITCAATALEQMADSLDQLMDYFAGEMREGIEARLQECASLIETRQ